jgi:dihydroorotate dehydrogenase electron transfer subunit
VGVQSSSAAAGLPPAQAKYLPGKREFECIVLDHLEENAEYKRLTVDLPEICGPIAPGQFFQILCPSQEGLTPFLRRPMSIFQVEPETRRLSFLYKVTGAGTRGLAALAPGDLLNIFGPLGVGFSLPANRAPIVILARGAGLATMAPLVPWARARGHAVTSILSARSPELIMSVAEMSRSGTEVVTVTDSEGTSGVEDVVRRLSELHERGRLGAVYVCGSNRLLLAAQLAAREWGVHGETAMEQQMACGLGMCFSCVREFREAGGIVHRRVCCEGPVFPLQDAVSW